MDAFEYQLEFIKKEYEALNDSIARMDEATRSTKNWAIALWTGSVSFAMTREEGLRNYVVFTAIIPFAFWFIDAWWRRHQREMIFRVNELSEFLNGDDLSQSFEEKKVVGLWLLDLRAKKSGSTEKRAEFTSWKRTMWFKTVCVFYLTLIITSLILGVVTWISTTN